MDDLGALQQIDHIVVLMLENRSFDNMLGYLGLDPTYEFREQVDGLDAVMENSYEDKPYRVHAFPGTTMKPWETPRHDGHDVDEQLADQGAGFVKNFVHTRAADVRSSAADPDSCCVTGYHTGDQLYAYDFLARSYTVCDRWFASVPGATMPNRLYSVCGTSGGLRSNQKVNGVDFPLYHLPSFVRHLGDKATWRWYRHDAVLPSTLSMFDPKYRLGHNSNFSLYSDFAKHCRAGKLANVSWVEPGFLDKFGLLHENDDHPPTDVVRGQRLVHEIYDALVSSPCWSSTLLVVVYDEHGGFFDHVAPPAAEDDDPSMRRYGVRVPALLVSPYARPGVFSTVLDHTSILRTILDRFRPDLDPGVMGRRVAAAANLSSALGERQARPAAMPPGPEPADGPQQEQDPQGIVDLIRSSHDGLSMARLLQRHVKDDPPGGRPLDDLQAGFIVAAGELSHLGAGPSKRDLNRGRATR